MDQNNITDTSTVRSKKRALHDQEFLGDKVEKICGCAVVKIDDEVIVAKMPVSYPQLLTAIVRHKYNANQAEAVTANYMAAVSGAVSEEKAAEYQAEYQAYQSWRDKAKTVAKEAFGIK